MLQRKGLIKNNHVLSASYFFSPHQYGVKTIFVFWEWTHS